MSSDAPGGSAQSAYDDAVLPFSTVKSRALGRLVRLGPLVDEILARHAYPNAVSELLGEALALVAMLGTTLKFEGELILQTNTDGPVGLIVVNFEAPGRLRGHASFNRDRVGSIIEAGQADHGRLLGSGYLALTIDPGKGKERYQGVVALEGGGLADAALSYFRQSEQLPTYVRLAVARHQTSADGHPGWRWRAGGLLLQHVAPVGGSAELDDGGRLMGEDDDHWRRVRFLAETVEDHEMLDPLLPPKRLLYRLFHEEGVRAGEARDMEVFCRCSQDRVDNLFQSFKGDDISDLRDKNGDVVVTCEFCNTAYYFDPGAQ
ncbi:MAG: Hsp33 family molecular chaperone [Hyphomicrobiaceae bacterium]